MQRAKKRIKNKGLPNILNVRNVTRELKHMLSYIGNDKFCESIKEYLCKFQCNNDLQR